jgi:outer membrane receptor protein involved in Fe transport
VLASIPGGALDLNDSRSENKISGTAVLSYKITPQLLTYASYSHGYKAGGFNLDRSALFRAAAPQGTPPLSGSGSVCVSTTQPGCAGVLASGADLEFLPETNDAIEVGAKYNGGWIDLNVAVFRQLFKNFQLNTFNGLNFIVENINSCDGALDPPNTDTDNNPRTGACTGKTRAGVKDTGVEIEAFTHPMPDLAINAGVTYSNVKYRDNLVGADGKPLSNALWQLPGRQISNAPKWTITGSAAWTPPIGSGGMHGLIYADARYMSRFNTGSDLDIEKVQDGFTVVNGRIGVEGPDDRWGIELWAQNLFDKTYKQVAFDAPIQGTPGTTTRAVEAGFFPRATQIYGAFLGEPRTFGVTLRGKLSFAPAPPPPYVAPPPPPPPPVVEQPAPPPPPPPPPPPAPVERGERGL